MAEIGASEIENFITGRDHQKYIVAIEAQYSDNIAHLIINDPEKGKYIEKHQYSPFMWMKHSVSEIMYGGNRSKIKEAMTKHGVKIKSLRTDNGEGYSPKRVAEGYKYLVTCKKSYNQLIWFFKEGGVDIYSKDTQDLFMKILPAEQFMIQSGKRLFKGMDDYNDVHRFQFDLETEGLDPEKDAIFQIGMKDNKGWELILETEGETPKEKRDSERLNIIRFFKEVLERKADIIAGYNSENFDWPFFEKRCERLNVPVYDFVFGLDGKTKLKRKEGKLKLGEDTETYMQTYLWGYNILDISHSVRRAQAINSDIKSWSLKWITKYSKIHKPNRVYVEGNKIQSTWKDNDNKYYIDDSNGDWFKYKETIESHNEKIASGTYTETTGKYIVQRYLLDDLWETEKVDSVYNQASFLLSKWLPTSYMRSSTMGTAGQWTLLMMAWSYENGLAIPDKGKKTKFAGGLSRLFETGFSEDVSKLDYAALYPKTTLTWGIFPETDISGVMKGLLTYIVDTRDTYKFLAEECKEKISELKDSEVMTEEIKSEIARLSKMKSDYDKKQLPVKILANSFFGSYGAPHIFPWGDMLCAERITCISRQNLRLMVRVFKDKFGFKPLIADTDGLNFSMPKTLSDYRYTPTGNHWKTTKYAGEELSGLMGSIAFFNETYMKGRMGLDVDDVYESTINFARKNYANLLDGKIKLVGNSIKSKITPTYITEFLDEGIKLLLHNKGQEFINLYYEQVRKVFYHKIPVLKIASKSKVKQTVEQYHGYCKEKNKTGRLKTRMAYMELIIANNLTPNLGEVIYYVNTGTSKLDSDVTMARDKTSGKKKLVINSKLIPQSVVDGESECEEIKYNAVKYLASLNSKVESLLVCFSKEIRDSIIIKPVRDRKTKLYTLSEFNLFTEEQCKLVSGQPLDPEDQDTYEYFMTMEDKEIKFWMSVDETPYDMETDEWESIKQDYIERKESEKIAGLASEKERIIKICRDLEVDDIEEIKSSGKVPKKILLIADIDTESGSFVSLEFDEPLMDLSVLFDFEQEAIARSKFYDLLTDTPEDNYREQWELFLTKIFYDDVFDFMRSKPETYELWCDYVTESGYDIIMGMTDGEIYEIWMSIMGKFPSSNESSEEAYTEYDMIEESSVTDKVTDQVSQPIDLMDEIRLEMSKVGDESEYF